MFMFIYSTVAKLGYVYMWKGRTGEKSKPVWPGGLMPSIDAIEVSFGSSQVLQGSYDTLLYDEYVRQPGNQVVAYSFTLPAWCREATLTVRDKVTLLIRGSKISCFSVRWQMKNICKLYFSEFVFSTIWNSYLRYVWHWSPKPRPTSPVLFTVWPLSSFAFINFAQLPLSWTHLIEF